MYHYLFTNDLRISNLDESLQKAAECFISNTIPSSSEDKSANNNIKTLGFYFDLTESSECARIASKGNVREVVLNFIKKFQFPNLRTKEGYEDTIGDGIMLAPMREIVKLLYTINLVDKSNAYLTRDEIKMFVFYNDDVAKNIDADLLDTVSKVLEYRKNGMIPTSINTKVEEHFWNHEDRQIREMVKILLWSGCIAEENDKIIIKHKNLTRENEADLFEIITCNSFWKGGNLVEYQTYMDIQHNRLIEIEILDKSDEKENYSLQELASILKDWYENPRSGSKTNAIHMFGIRYGKAIINGNHNVLGIIKAAQMEESYRTELNKGIAIYKNISERKDGLAFVDEIDKTENVVLEKEDDIDFKELDEVRVEGGDNILYYGVPGSGKSHSIDKECNNSSRMERVVFHPDYTYSDFVGQILPRLNDDCKLEYVFTPGPFTKLMDKAIKDPENKYYLIIEEINRGNASAIFGEIFQLLDRIDEEDKEEKKSDVSLKVGTSKYFITNYDIAKEIYKDVEHRIMIPSNMYLRATMNTSDQNVFTLDTAFQRRWLMKQVENNIMGARHSGAKIEGSNITWGAFATYVNELVLNSSNEMASSEDKCLGAYFVKAKELSTNIFPEKVLKYLWDDAFKLDKEAIFDDKYKSLEQLIIDFETTSNSDRLKQVLRAEVYSKMLEKVKVTVNEVGRDADKNGQTE